MGLTNFFLANGQDVGGTHSIRVSKPTIFMRTVDSLCSRPGNIFSTRWYSTRLEHRRTSTDASTDLSVLASYHANSSR